MSIDTRPVRLSKVSQEQEGWPEPVSDSSQEPDRTKRGVVVATNARRVAGARAGSGSHWMATTAGWALTALVAVFMASDVLEHLSGTPLEIQLFHQIGFPLGAVLPLSIVEAWCLVLYLIPRSKVLGAILLTGYLGGAVALQVRVEVSFFSEGLVPVYTATVMWLGNLPSRWPLASVAGSVGSVGG